MKKVYTAVYFKIRKKKKTIKPEFTAKIKPSDTKENKDIFKQTIQISSTLLRQ